MILQDAEGQAGLAPADVRYTQTILFFYIWGSKRENAILFAGDKSDLFFS